MDIIDKFFFVGLTATLLAFLSVCTFVCYDVFHGRIKYPVEYILIIMIGLLWVIMLFFVYCNWHNEYFRKSRSLL